MGHGTARGDSRLPELREQTVNQLPLQLLGLTIITTSFSPRDRSTPFKMATYTDAHRALQQAFLSYGVMPLPTAAQVLAKILSSQRSSLLPLHVPH